MKVTNLRPDPFVEVLAAIARGRGYNPSRAAIVAQEYSDAAKRMSLVEVRVSRLVPDSPTEQELQAFANAVAIDAGKQVLNHCLHELARVAIELSYPRQL
jgi:hypothetical protein